MLVLKGNLCDERLKRKRMKRSTSHNSTLQRERVSHGWKQETVAAKLGVDVRTVRRWESGHPVSPLNIAGLTRLFEKSAEELGLIVETDTDTSAVVAQLLPEDPHALQPSGGKPSHVLSQGLSASFTPFAALPIGPTPLIGREQEVAAVGELLRAEEVRLLTLTGSGGTGKTRLGVQVAAEMQDIFGDGVFFVNLAAITDPWLVPVAIAQALGIWEAAGQPLQESLKASLREKHLLLLLDNFEQVVSAAGQVADLLAACPRLKVLVTSREVLHMGPEYEFVVPPLALPERSLSSDTPNLTILSRNPAVALFIQRARAIRPDFQITAANIAAVVEICIRLDGLPLAIELAAARMKLLSPRALLTWLDRRLDVLTTGARDAPARQKTLRNTIAWSYSLLGPEEQRIFRRLSVFVGGFTLEGAVAVCTLLVGESALAVLDGVDSLIDKSMLLLMGQGEGEEQRFMMLETIREYGLEALAKSGETEVMRQAHALTYLALAEEAEPNLDGPEQALWLARLEREVENLRAALGWLMKQGEDSLRLAGALTSFWIVRGQVSEGRRWLERTLASSQGAAASVRARALEGAGILAFYQHDYDKLKELMKEAAALVGRLGDRGDKRVIALLKLGQGEMQRIKGEHAAARALHEESLALFKELKDNSWGITYTLRFLARDDYTQGLYARARAQCEESLAIARERGDHAEIGEAANLLASIVLEQGDVLAAHALAEESLAQAREVRNRLNIAAALGTLAAISLALDDSAAARAGAEESLAISREVGDWRGSTYFSSLRLLGQVLLHQANAAEARPLLEESLAFARKVGDRWGLAHTLRILGQATLRQGNDAEARALYEEGLRIFLEFENRKGIALSLIGLGEVAVKQGQPLWAARLWGAAETLCGTVSSPLSPIERASYENSVAALRALLGEEPFASAWAEGRTQTAEQILGVHGQSTCVESVSLAP
jgi:predicted ATPase/transcriptional regulator with XRE-family HTH domain